MQVSVPTRMATNSSSANARTRPASSTAQASNRPASAENTDFVGTRTGILDPKTLSREDYNALIARDPAYGRIICRCEQVTEGEIVDAIHRVPGTRSLDGVKRRTRAGMGRCQAGFCSPRVMAILARELGVDEAEITKSGGHSQLLTGYPKEGTK